MFTVIDGEYISLGIGFIFMNIISIFNINNYILKGANTLLNTKKSL